MKFVNQSIKDRRIKSFITQDGNTVTGDYNHYLEILNEEHGDYDIDWILMRCKDGVDCKEVERYSCKYIQSIAWE